MERTELPSLGGRRGGLGERYGDEPKGKACTAEEASSWYQHACTLCSGAGLYRR
jgi:hypothetical protein